MAAIAAISLRQASCRGGETVTITGTFPRSTDLTVTIGGVAAYGGSGFGTLPQSGDGLTVTVAVPAGLPGGDHAVVVDDGVAPAISTDPIRVIERAWAQKVFSTRLAHPPWSAVGKRRLELEPLTVCTPDEEDAMLPKLVRTDATTITLVVPANLPTPRIRFSDDILRKYAPASAPTFDPSGLGLGGLDAGAEANDTWYYLYLVPNGTSWAVVGSVNPPATGPTGYSIYRYVGAVRNDAGGDLLPMSQLSASVFAYATRQPITLATSPTTWDGAPVNHDLSADVPSTCSRVDLRAHFQAGSGAYGDFYFWVNGESAGGAAAAIGWIASGTAFAVDTSVISVATLADPRNFYYQRVQGLGALNFSEVAVTGWVDGWL